MTRAYGSGASAAIDETRRGVESGPATSVEPGPVEARHAPEHAEPEALHALERALAEAERELARLERTKPRESLFVWRAKLERWQREHTQTRLRVDSQYRKVRAHIEGGQRRAAEGRVVASDPERQPQVTRHRPQLLRPR